MGTVTCIGALLAHGRASGHTFLFGRLEEQLNTLEGKVEDTDEHTRHILANSTALWLPESQLTK